MDLDALIHPARLGAAVAEATGTSGWADLSGALVSGGKSNLTFVLTSPSGEELILRRPPTGELLPSAHDMGREVRVQQALVGTAVPVPQIILFDDGDLLGVPCYVMERVDGLVIRAELPTGYAQSSEQRRAMAEVFIATIADLHGVSPQDVGLHDYGRPEGFMERQVRRWAGQWEATRTQELPALEELGARLAANVPAAQRSTIVHGDYRIDNVLYDRDDPRRIRAVLDWEMSTLGDPLADLGQLLLYWRAAGERQLRLIPGITHLDGFPGREELATWYAARSGLDVSDLGFYLAFAHYKFAIITAGVAARSRAGTMGGQDFGDLDDDIDYLAEYGLNWIKEH